MATKKSSQMKGTLLEFLGALIYIYLVFTWLGSGGTPLWLSGAGAIWLPVIAGVALISSLTLFIMSLVALAGMNSDMMIMGAMKATWWGGFAIFVLTAGGAWFWWAILGFLLAYIGTGWQKM